MVLPFVRSVSVVTDNDYRPRLTIAFALAVGLHLIVSWFFPVQTRTVSRERIVAERVSVTKRKPMPKPTMRATPRPRRTLAPRIVVYRPAPKAALPVRKRHGGKASPHKHVARLAPHMKPRPVSLAKQKSVGVAGTGVGAATGAGVGVGGEGGSASGVSGSGHGDAADASSAPCGYVEFKPLRQEDKAGKQIVWVQIIVHLRSGATLADDLHWPFVYAGNADNPWSARNLRNPNFQTVMQLPPPDFDVAAEQEPATVLAVQQTGPDGFTLLEPCPEQPVP